MREHIIGKFAERWFKTKEATAVPKDFIAFYDSALQRAVEMGLDKRFGGIDDFYMAMMFFELQKRDNEIAELKKRVEKLEGNPKVENKTESVAPETYTPRPVGRPRTQTVGA